MSNVKTMSRLCGACLNETAVAAVRYATDELVWICPHCGYLELSGIDDDSVLLPPTEVELREIMATANLGDKLCDLQRSIRLGSGNADHDLLFGTLASAQQLEQSSQQLDLKLDPALSPPVGPHSFLSAILSAIKVTWNALCLLVWLLWRGI